MLFNALESFKKFWKAHFGNDEVMVGLRWGNGTRSSIIMINYNLGSIASENRKKLAIINKISISI